MPRTYEVINKYWGDDGRLGEVVVDDDGNVQSYGDDTDTQIWKGLPFEEFVAHFRYAEVVPKDGGEVPSLDGLEWGGGSTISREYDLYVVYTNEFVGRVKVEGDRMEVIHNAIPDAWVWTILPEQIHEYGWDGALEATRQMRAVPTDDAREGDPYGGFGPPPRPEAEL